MPLKCASRLSLFCILAPRLVIVLGLCYLMVTSLAISVCLGLGGVEYFFTSFAFLLFCAYRFESPCTARGAKPRFFWALLLCAPSSALRNASLSSVARRNMRTKPSCCDVMKRVAAIFGELLLSCLFMSLGSTNSYWSHPIAVRHYQRSDAHALVVARSIVALLLLGLSFLVLGYLLQRRICRVLVTDSCSVGLTARVVRLNVVRLSAW